MSEASQSSVTCIKGSWNKKLEVQLQYSFAVEKKLLTRWKHKSSTREKKEANVEEEAEAECAKNFLFLAKKKDTFCLKKKLRTCAAASLLCRNS